MEYVLPGLVTVFILLFVLRRHLKRIVLDWVESRAVSEEAKLAELIVREKKRMKEEEGRTESNAPDRTT